MQVERLLKLADDSKGEDRELFSKELEQRLDPFLGKWRAVKLFETSVPEIAHVDSNSEFPRFLAGSDILAGAFLAEDMRSSALNILLSVRVFSCQSRLRLDFNG